jgi:Xaa-Pro aminopeptidase
VPTAELDSAARSERLTAAVSEQELDLLLVSAPVNVRYLTGYTGSNGLALIGAEPSGPRRFFTDFRYAAQSAVQVPASFERHIASPDLYAAATASIGPPPSAGGRLGFDDTHLSVKLHSQLREAIAPGWELVPSGGAVERLREIKDEHEVQRIRAAAELIDGLLDWVAERGLARRSERQVAIDLEHEMRLRGAQEPSFPTIVASGAHGALPHAEPRDEKIDRGVLVTIDLGARLDGYCSDCTRTFATGPLEGEAVLVYELVLRAQEAGLEALAPGLSGREVDAVARALITEAGYGEQFGHGLGHGVGLEIHEAPRLSPRGSRDPLRPGHIVTIEPGVYLPARFGVRIEDLVVVGDGGAERLSRYPKQLLTVD